MDIGGDDLERLEELGYDRAWLDTGVLELELLRAQSTELRAPGGDRNIEHYAVAALRFHLDRIGKPTDAQLDAMLEVAQRHPRADVYRDLLHRLAKRDRAQLERMSVAGANSAIRNEAAARARGQRDDG